MDGVESQIAEWRAYVAKGPAVDDRDVDELEAHLRDQIAELDAAGTWPAPAVTEVVPLTTFYPAEGYHQDYFAENPNQAYCRVVIAPKVAKFRKQHLDRLRA